MSFSKRILIGMTAGVAVGPFFGELVSPLKIVADGFVKLLQMTVLPYLIISIISSLADLCGCAPPGTTCGSCNGRNVGTCPHVRLVDAAGLSA